MLRGERIRVYRNELLGVYETGPEREMDGALKTSADADTHVSDVEACEKKREGRFVVKKRGMGRRRRSERGRGKNARQIPSGNAARLSVYTVRVRLWSTNHIAMHRYLRTMYSLSGV